MLNLMRFCRGALIAGVLAIVWPVAGFAASVLPLDLDAIIDGSETAFQGRVTNTWSARDEQGVIVTYTTFEVLDALKGDVATARTIKQIGGRVGNDVRRVDGIPTFTPGEDYVVFLYGVSEAGFSSPIGLAQGRFSVRPGPKGMRVANGRDFREMLPAASLAKLPAGLKSLTDETPQPIHDMDLEEFKQLVRERAAR